MPTPDGPAPTRLPAGLPRIQPSSQPAPAHRADDGHDHLRRVLGRSADYYHQQLLAAPAAEPARRYLTERGIEPADWAKWKLGWAPDQWRGLCNRLGDDQAAVDAGVANTRRGRTYDVLRGRVVFPIRDTSGDVIGFAGRTLPGTDAGQPKYLNTRTTALYHKSDTLYGIHEAADGIRSTATAGIVEGYTDAIAAHSAGLTNVVATGGTAFTQSHLQRIIDAGAHHLTAGFDGDDPGRTSQQKLTDQAHQAGIPTTSVTLPTGTDPASLEPDALLDHWQAGLPQPWAHIQQHLDGGDVHTRARGHRHIAAAYHNTDPTLANLAAHQALTHTYGATPPHPHRLAPAPSPPPHHSADAQDPASASRCFEPPVSGGNTPQTGGGSARAALPVASGSRRRRVGGVDRQIAPGRVGIRPDRSGYRPAPHPSSPDRRPEPATRRLLILDPTPHLNQYLRVFGVHRC